MYENTKIFILAAGKGTRMESDLPKSLHLVGGKPLIINTLLNLISAGFKDITVVVGYKSDLVKQEVSKHFPEINFFEQQILNGTGQAVLEILESQTANLPERILVMNADDSLFYEATDIKRLLESHVEKSALASLFVTADELERNYRKVLLDSNGNFANFSRKPQSEGYTVTGLYVFESEFILNYLYNQKRMTEQGELKVTDFMYLSDIKDRINVLSIDKQSWFGINTQAELALANELWNKRHK